MAIMGAHPLLEIMEDRAVVDYPVWNILANYVEVALLKNCLEFEWLHEWYKENLHITRQNEWVVCPIAMSKKIQIFSIQRQMWEMKEAINIVFFG